MSTEPDTASKEIFSASKDSLRLNLLKNLSEDLKYLGHNTKILESDEHYTFEFEPADINQLTPDEIRSIYNHIRCCRLKSESEFIKQMEEGKVLDFLIDGQELNINTIKPTVQICKTNTDKSYYRYFRHLQTVPNSSGYGRRIYILVFDEGQETRPLMAIIGLSSSFYSLKNRDEYFGWNLIDSKTATQEIRENGLRRIMQLSVCMALPPYNFLLGGKLAALLALSTPIQEEFRNRYRGDPLLAIVTTSALSEHAPIFNRLNLRQFGRDRYSRYNNEMYRRIGVTSEYSTVMISNQTLDICRAVIGPRLQIEREAGIQREGRSRLVQRALSQCGIGKSVLRIIPKGLYVGFTHKRNIALLKSGRGGSNSAVRVFDVDDCVEYWKRKWLVKGLGNRERLTKVRAFRKSHAAVGACLLNGNVLPLEAV